MLNIFSKPRESLKERCMRMLKVLPNPLDPGVKALEAIEKEVGCSRPTTFRALKTLRLLHKVTLLETNVTLQEYNYLSKRALRDVVEELKSHLKFMNSLLGKMLKKDKFDGYDMSRLEKIQRYIGEYKPEVEKE